MQRLVEMHGGWIKARSKGEGFGSEFIVRLQLLTSLRKELQSPAEIPAQINVERPKKLGLRLMVADDNRDAANMLARVLRALGHETRVAYDGKAAVDEAETLRPDVCLVDIGMLKLNGYETTRHVRQ